MLAQNFKLADDLGLTDKEQAALIKVLGMLERGEISAKESSGKTIAGTKTAPIGFDMGSFYSKTECGTVCCICGWAEYIGQLPVHSLAIKRMENGYEKLYGLFEPPVRDALSITPAQAAMALRSYLTTGDACWLEAIA